VLKKVAFSNYEKASYMEKKTIKPMIQTSSITDPALTGSLYGMDILNTSTL
jgi:hypothetical protein